MERRVLLSAYVVANTGDDTSPGSLRWAITEVDSSPGVTGQIDFDIPGSGTQTIELDSALPAITSPVLIDGSSQPGYQDGPLIEIDGAGSGGSGVAVSDGLVVTSTAAGSTIRGLALVGFADSAIVLNSGGHDVISGDDLGLSPSGSAAVTNQQGLTLIGSSGNTIGAGAGGEGNVISGNSGDGILIEPGTADSSGNLIVGNEIGTTPDGLHALGNGESGIAIDGVSGNEIGMLGSGLENVISGNIGPGISVTGQATGTTIQNDFIGVGIDGETPVGNQSDGIALDDAPGTMIGGLQPGEGNVISANQGNGISTAGVTAGSWVAGNAIGTDIAGGGALGNLDNGILLGSSGNSIGGTATGAANVIDFNGTGRVGAGVQLVGDVDQNMILSNSIYANAGLGINLGDGPTPNHQPGTAGPNNYQNYPTLSAAEGDGSGTTVTGTLDEQPDTTYMVQFFSNPEEDPSGYGQGHLLLGGLEVTTDGQGAATFTATLPVAASAGQYISATATDPSGDTSEFSADVGLQAQINLQLSGTATPDPVLDGDTLTYALTVSNKGLIAADAVTLTDQLPAGVTVQSVQVSQGMVVPGMLPGTVTVNLSNIPAGAAATVTITVLTGPDAVGTIDDAAAVTSQQTDPLPALESLSIPATVLTSADVSVALVEETSPALVGGDLTYTMTVADDGPQGATGVVATLPVASGLQFVSATGGTGTCVLSGGQVVADIGDLADGAQVVVTVVLQADTVGDASETADVTSLSQDPDLSNNGATAVADVEPAADIEVQVVADTPAAAVGEPLTYTVTVINNGPSTATGVAVTDTLPAGVVDATATAAGGAVPTVADGVVAVTFATLASGASATLDITATDTAAPGSDLTDQATAAGQQADPDPADGSATLTIPVLGVSDLSVAATAQPGPVYAGQPLTYTISVTNLGPADEPDAVVSTTLPAGLAVDSVAASQGSDPGVTQGDQLSVDLGPLGDGDTADITLVATPGAADAGMMTTTFTATGQDYDPDTIDNVASVSTVVEPSADLGVVIAPGNGPAMAQVDWTYTVQVADAGPSPATGVVAELPIPAGATFVSCTSSQGGAPALADGQITAQLGSISPGSPAVVTVTILPTPAASAAGSMTLSAAASGQQSDPDPSNDQQSIVVAVAPSVDLAIQLQSTPQSVETGHVVSFTATVTNLGTTPASGVVVNLPTVGGLVYNSAAMSQGSPAIAAGAFIGTIGDLAPGGSASVTIVELATAPGSITQPATVSQDQYNLDQSGASASVTDQVVESAGIVGFSSTSYELTDRAGTAVIPVDRFYGTNGTITVNYQTVAVDATPGLDYVPTSGTLTLGPGQASGTIVVPVLDDPYQDHDDYVNIVLDDPTGGAVLGQATTATLHIQDVDPDTTPPQVSGLTWAGSAAAITGVTLSFTAPLDATYATDPDDYRILNESTGQVVPLASIAYNPSTFSVTVVPQEPLPSGQFDQILVVGTGAAAVRDLAGNLLDGAGNGVAGSDYVASFAQGTRLKYRDNSGNTVTLKLTHGGYMEQILNASGAGVSLTLVDIVPQRTTLSGTIKAGKRGNGQTDLGAIKGLGQFGQVKVLLKTPPFRVNQLPFQRRGKSVL